MRPIIFLLISLFFSASSVMAANYYKWKDDKGVWHFDTKPPADQPADKLRVVDKSGYTSASDNSEEDSEDGEGSPKAAEPETESNNCIQARKNLEILDNNPIVARDEDGDGKPENLTLEQHQQEIATAKQHIAAFCRPKPQTPEPQ